MKSSSRFSIFCAVFGSISLACAGFAAELPIAPAPAPNFSKAAEPRARSLENFMAGTASRSRDERFLLFVEALRDDPGAIMPRNYIMALIDTRADARKVAADVLEISRNNPQQFGLAAAAGRLCYMANAVPAEYLDVMRTVLDSVKDPALLPEPEKSDYYAVVGVYSSALKQARDYRTGNSFLEQQLDRDASTYREMMLRFAIDFEYFFTRFGSRESRWLGLADSDREAAKKRFEELFAESETREVPTDDLERRIDFCLAVGKPEVALRVAERLATERPSPQNATRLAYVAIAAKAFDKVPAIAEKLSQIDGWKGVSQLILINSLIAQEKFEDTVKEIAGLRVPMARDEYMLRLYAARNDYAGMRDRLEEMEKTLSPGVRVDLANALRQVAVAEKLRDAALLNRIWKLLEDTEQILADDAANSVGYVAAVLNIRLDEAEKLLQYAVDGAPDNYAYLDSMAWLRYRQGKLDEAEKYMLLALRASEQETARGVLFDHYGDILLAQDRKSEALAAYREALDYDDDDELDRPGIEEKCRKLE